MGYCTVDDVRCRFPDQSACGVDLDAKIPDATITKWIGVTCAFIDQELCHRYDVPFTTAPDPVVEWNADLAAYNVLVRCLSSVPEFISLAWQEARARLRSIAACEQDLCGELVRDPENAGDGHYVVGGSKSGLFPCPPTSSTVCPTTPATVQTGGIGGSLAAHEATYDHSLLHVQGTDQGLDTGGPDAVTAADLAAHLVDVNNPHMVTAAQAGAEPVGAVGAHEAAHDHTLLHVQGTDQGLDTGGPSAVTAADLAAHLVDTANPHMVTAEQTGAADLIEDSDMLPWWNWSG